MRRLISGLRPLIVLVLLILPQGNLWATTIDFEGLAFTSITSGGDTVPVAGSVLANEFMGVGVLFGKAGVSAGVAVVRDTLAPSSGLNSVGGLNAAGVLPGTGSGALVGDIYFSFVVPGSTTAGTTAGVSFTIGDGGGDLDMFQIRSYDLGGLLIDTQNVSGNSRFLVTIGVAGVNRVEVDFSGDFGYSLDDLNFNAPEAAVPEPGTLGLLGLGLLLAARMGRARMDKRG